MNTSSTSESRIWTVLSHLSALTFGMGILLPIVGWADQRRKSNYASFQTLQALGYQSLGFTVWILSYLVVAILFAIVVLIVADTERGSGIQDPALAPWMAVFSVVMVGFLAFYVLLPVVAAIACALGKDFRYPILGDRLAQYLGYDPLAKPDEQTWLVEEREFRWVAAAGHFSVLIMLWGMLAPLAAWMLYGKRSLFLRFQSIQTLVYQAVVTVLYFAGIVLYVAGLGGLIAAIGGMGPTVDNSSFGIAGMVIFGGVLACGGVIILAIPLLHILGQWAGYRVLKGDDYRYPLVGRLADKWISKEPIHEEKPV